MRMRRALLLAAAMAIPVTGFALATSPTAWAGSHNKVVCSTLSGPLSNLTISCTGGANGTDSATGVNGSVLAVGGMVNFTNGDSITFGKPASGSTSAKHCPGYVKGATSEPVATKFTLPVTADVGDNIKVPGKAKGAVCINNVSGNVSILKALKVS